MKLRLGILLAIAATLGALAAVTYLTGGEAGRAEAAGDASAGGPQRVLAPDAIPAIDNPTFVSAEAAEIPSSATVIGLKRGKDARAYSVYLLNGHEIVNDTYGKDPVAVTW